MKTVLIAICLSVAAAVASAQELRIDATSEATMRASGAAIMPTIPPDQIEPFKQALLYLMIADQWGTDGGSGYDANIERFRRLFHGKTASEVIEMAQRAKAANPPR